MNQRKRHILLLTFMTLLLPTKANFFYEENWRERKFQAPKKTIAKVLPTCKPTVVITTTQPEVTIPILDTHYGTNTTFRRGRNPFTRTNIYKDKIGIMRYPAGSGSNHFFFDGRTPDDWETCLNKQGKVIPSLHYNGSSPSVMDPATFVKFRKAANSEATIVVNYFYARYGKTACGTREGRVKQAAEYAASFVKKMNVELKAGIKYWEIGNECYGSWELGYSVDNPQIGTVTPREYGEDFCVFAEAMKAVDPSIKVGLVVKYEDWNADALKYAQHHADFLVYHEYFTSVPGATYEAVMDSVSVLGKVYESLQDQVMRHTKYPADHFPITLTEFNSRGAMNYTVSNALFVSQCIGEAIKAGYGIASIWNSESGWSKKANSCMSMLAINDPSQPKFSPRATYVPYFYYPQMMGDQLLETTTSKEKVQVYSSTFTSGEQGYVITNESKETQHVKLANVNNGNKAYWYECYNNSLTFDAPDAKKFYVNGRTSRTLGGGPNLERVPAYVSKWADDTVVEIRPNSVIYMTIR